MMTDAAILAQTVSPIEIVWRPDWPSWANVFLRGRRVGYVVESESDGGFAVTLNSEWGARRYRHDVFRTRELAVECVHRELADC